MKDQTEDAIASFIAKCDNPAKLRQICKNARMKNNIDVERAASLRLYEILPSEEAGAINYDIWKTIYALEHSLTLERGRTTRLQRTRNSISKIGEIATVAALLQKKRV